MRSSEQEYSSKSFNSNALYSSTLVNEEYIKDHFTLPLPTAKVRFRNNSRTTARVITGHGAQFILEETYEKTKSNHPTVTTTIKSAEDSSGGLKVLQTVYAVICGFFVGFLWIFCMQILILLSLDMIISIGHTEYQTGISWGHVAGLIVVMPNLTDGLSNLMVVAGAFVWDAWRGHYLVKQVLYLQHFESKMAKTAIDWCFFIAFLGLPICFMSMVLVTGSDDWWYTGLVVWFSFVATLFLGFSTAILVEELRSFYRIVQNLHKDNNLNDNNNNNNNNNSSNNNANNSAVTTHSTTTTSNNNLNQGLTFFDCVEKSILMRQVYMFSGYKSISLSETTAHNHEILEHCKILDFLWFTLLPCFNGKMYELLDSPEQVHCWHYVKQSPVYLTAQSWSLDKFFCQPGHTHYFAVSNGPDGISRGQICSSLVCSLVGVLLMYFFFIGLLVYLQGDDEFNLFMGIIIVFISLSAVKNGLKAYQTAKKVRFNMFEDPNDMTNDYVAGKMKPSQKGGSLHELVNEGVYLEEMTLRITKPTNGFCWFLFWFDIIVFVLWPMISLFLAGNYPIGLIYLIVIGFTRLRYYLNPILALLETGRIDLATAFIANGNGSSTSVSSGRSSNSSSARTSSSRSSNTSSNNNGADGICRRRAMEYDDEKRRWRHESLLTEVTDSVTYSNSYHIWFHIFALFLKICILVFFFAYDSDASSPHYGTHTYLKDFYYPPQPTVQYESCHLGKETTGGGPVASLADYIVLSQLPYSSPNDTPYNNTESQFELDEWFGKGEAIDNVNIVNSYRERVGGEFESSPIEFKLITFPSKDNFAIVSIQGTNSKWDFYTNVQLWTTTIWMQLLRSMFPLGYLFTPVMHRLVYIVTYAQPTCISKIQFYEHTSRFVNFIKSNNFTVQTTGHSLGGGLAMITGAKVGVLGVGLSAPNAMISRDSFGITAGAVNAYTFNIMPERDAIPKIDEPGRKSQSIRCTAERHGLVECHDPLRSLCEVLYACGSGERPVPCECVTAFGYPEPSRRNQGNRTFAEACGGI